MSQIFLVKFSRFVVSLIVSIRCHTTLVTSYLSLCHMILCSVITRVLFLSHEFQFCQSITWVPILSICHMSCFSVTSNVCSSVISLVTEQHDLWPQPLSKLFIWNGAEAGTDWQESAGYGGHQGGPFDSRPTICTTRTSLPHKISSRTGIGNINWNEPNGEESKYLGVKIRPIRCKEGANKVHCIGSLPLY